MILNIMTYIVCFNSVIIVVSLPHNAASDVALGILGPPVSMSVIVLVQIQVQVLDLSSPISLRFGLETFFRPDSVHVPLLLCCFCLFHVNHTSHRPQKKYLTLLLASGKYLMLSNDKCMYSTFSVSKS